MGARTGRGDGAASVVAKVARGMRRVKGAASAVPRALLAAAVIALILAVLEVLVGVVLVGWEDLFG